MVPHSMFRVCWQAQECVSRGWRGAYHRVLFWSLPIIKCSPTLSKGAGLFESEMACHLFTGESHGPRNGNGHADAPGDEATADSRAAHDPIDGNPPAADHGPAGTNSIGVAGKPRARARRDLFG